MSYYIIYNYYIQCFCLYSISGFPKLQNSFLFNKKVFLWFANSVDDFLMSCMYVMYVSRHEYVKKTVDLEGRQCKSESRALAFCLNCAYVAFRELLGVPSRSRLCAWRFPVLPSPVGKSAYRFDSSPTAVICHVANMCAIHFLLLLFKTSLIKYNKLMKMCLC